MTQPGSPVDPHPADAESERAFLDRYDPTAFERPSVTVDVALLSTFDGALNALLLRRAAHPFRGHWALPGGFVGIAEDLDAAAGRILAEKVGVAAVFLEQLYTFGSLSRDPRTRVITVAYYALLPASRLDAALDRGLSWSRLDVPWPGEAGGPVSASGPDGAPRPLAFDHADLLGMAVKRLRGKLDYAPIGYELLPEEFPLRDLQTVHETISGRPLNKDSFRRRMVATGELEATGRHERAVGHRPAELYRVRPRPTDR